MDDRTYDLGGDSEGVASFHRARRLFVVMDDRVVVSAPDSLQSHREFLLSLGLGADRVEELMNISLRGYVAVSGSVYLYRGYDFDFGDQDLAAVPGILADLAQQLDLSEDAEVFGGVVAGRAGEVWPPRRRIGTVGELR